MKILFYSAREYDVETFNESNKIAQNDIKYVEEKLNNNTVHLAQGYSAICVFVNDCLDREVIDGLAEKDVGLIALRCAGFNNVDIERCKQKAIKVVRVPEYSPYAVAEHALCLMLSLNRKINKSYNRVRDGNFSLQGLLGFDFHGKTIGIIGTGKIGSVLAKIVVAMGMRVVAYDPFTNLECINLGVEYVSIDELYELSDVISLHCPLNDHTKYLINQKAIDKMKDGVMLINTSRGAVVDTCALIDGLKSKKIGYLGMDVYEQEANLFFMDKSCEIIDDDVFERLLTFPNVLITAHQGFFTEQALMNIADTTLQSVEAFENKQLLRYEVK